MCSNIYIQNEAKKNFKEWTYEGMSFLLQQHRFKAIAITALSKLLKLNQSVEFKYNSFYYEIFKSTDSGYIVNVYSSDERDAFNGYLDVNIIDGGLCTGSARDAIEFML